MQKFEKYLDKVRTDNPDEYNEIGEILTRYAQLENAHRGLEKDLNDLNEILEKQNEEMKEHQVKAKT